MRRSTLRAGLSTMMSVVALGACGPAAEQTPAAAPASTGAPAATAAASASATAAPAASTDATASASALASASAPPSKPARPTLRFWSFDGPADGPAITGARGWTAVATGAADDRYRHVFISVEDFVKTVGTENHWRSPAGDIITPVAMGANLAPPAALKKGDPIFAENSNDSMLARVVSADGDTVKMKYVFGDLVDDLEVPRAEVVLLDGTLRLGTPVAFKDAGKWYVGRLLVKTADDAWVALHYTDNQPYVKVKAADVRALDLKKVLKVGDKCMADSSYVSKNELWPGKITKVIEDGVFYEVKTDKGQTWTVPFHHVSTPL